MGLIQPLRPALLLMAAFSHRPEALIWGRQRAEDAWGAIVLESPPMSFEFTTFYESTMGPSLQKVLWAFEPLVELDQLSGRKLVSNAWEQEYAATGNHDVLRPLNLDPGYLTEAKLVLATTKDRDHRIYLGQGIFAEVTLSYRRGSWLSHAWTYPDYQTDEYHQFFTRCREYLRNRYRSGDGGLTALK